MSRSGTGKGRKEGETRVVHWTQLLMWALFLSAVMFFLGFLIGYRKAEKEVLEAARAPVIGSVPRLPDPVVETPPQAAEDGEDVWGILTERYEGAESTPGPEPAVPKPVSKPVFSEDSSPPDFAAAETVFSVQVGASRDPGRAEALRAELAEKGYPRARVQKAEIATSGTWYRIRVGLFRDKGAAEDLASEVRRREGVEPRVVAEKVNE